MRLFVKDKVMDVNPEDFLTIHELEKLKNKMTNLNIKDRKSVKILFIDDGGFDIEPLKQLGYIDIDVELEFKNMNQIDPYDIIFCDINDVAKNIYPIGQGAQLANDIKLTHPEKFVIIFSAQNQKPSFHKYYEKVDAVIDKTADLYVFQEVINKYISIQNDPIAYWEQLEKEMIHQKLNKIYISKLEHYFVLSFLDKKNYISLLSNKQFGQYFDRFVSFIQLLGTAIDLYFKFIGGK